MMPLQSSIEHLYAEMHKWETIKKEMKQELSETVPIADELLLDSEIALPYKTIESLLIRSTQWDNIPLVSVSTQLKAFTRGDIKLVARAITILADTDWYDIYHRRGQYYVKTKWQLDCQKAINKHMFVPPMVSRPNIINSNKDTVHRSYDESMILGNNLNYHQEDISLDVLNTLNQQKYYLDVHTLKSLNEQPDFEAIVEKAAKKGVRLTVKEEKAKWDVFLEQREEILPLLKDGFYFVHKVDKRGRIYSCGYHINAQGTEYQKAMINLPEELCA